MKGGGGREAGGAGGYPAGWKPACQDANRVSASAREPSVLWSRRLGGRNHAPSNLPEIVLPFSARKRRLRLEKMAYHLTARASGKTAMRPKYRVRGFSRNDRDLPLESRRRCPELRRKSRPTPTIFTPGIPQWPSRDPIGEDGGMNLYGFVRNDSENWVDFLGYGVTDAAIGAGKSVYGGLAWLSGLGAMGGGRFSGVNRIGWENFDSGGSSREQIANV